MFLLCVRYLHRVPSETTATEREIKLLAHLSKLENAGNK